MTKKHHSLFNVVVDTQATAKALFDAIKERGPGRITCMPLSGLKTRNVNYPEANDAIPMINTLKFDKKYTKAFEHIFGRTVICPDIAVASQYARSHGINAIDLDGKSSDKRGALTGGFIDKKKSRLKAVALVNSLRAKYEQEQQKSQDLKNRIRRLEQELIQATQKISQAEAAVNRADREFYDIPDQLRSKTSQLSRLREEMGKRRYDIE
jgi:structural maintenance of chromosome 3 (chondroitin sulfate proteoglycan 6)